MRTPAKQTTNAKMSTLLIDSFRKINANKVVNIVPRATIVVVIEMGRNSRENQRPPTPKKPTSALDTINFLYFFGTSVMNTPWYLA